MRFSKSTPDSIAPNTPSSSRNFSAGGRTPLLGGVLLVEEVHDDHVGPLPVAMAPLDAPLDALRVSRQVVVDDRIAGLQVDPLRGGLGGDQDLSMNDEQGFEGTASRLGHSAPDDRPRCAWVTDDPLYVAYHDEEWGVPVHDDRRLFEMLVLEGAQAGLSWLTILKKRARYREVYAGFDPAKVARFTPARQAKLLQDPGIVRNRLKVEAAVTNARAELRVQREHGSFDAFLREFLGSPGPRRRPRSAADVPARTPESDRLSRELKARGFEFVGPTIVYAFMQAVGIVDDHVATCFRARRSRSPRTGSR